MRRVCRGGLRGKERIVQHQEKPCVQNHCSVWRARVEDKLFGIPLVRERIDEFCETEGEGRGSF